MCNRNPIASLLLTVFSSVVLPVGLLADLSTVEKSNQRPEAAIVGAYLVPPSSIPTSGTRQCGIRDGSKKKPFHVLTFGLRARTQLPFGCHRIDADLLRRWQPHLVRLICDRSPPTGRQN
jgi:hypothetical protein